VLSAGKETLELVPQDDETYYCAKRSEINTDEVNKHMAEKKVEMKTWFDLECDPKEHDDGQWLHISKSLHVNSAKLKSDKFSIKFETSDSDAGLRYDEEELELTSGENVDAEYAGNLKIKYNPAMKKGLHPWSTPLFIFVAVGCIGVSLICILCIFCLCFRKKKESDEDRAYNEAFRVRTEQINQYNYH
jgi:hypothetical protein